MVYNTFMTEREPGFKSFVEATQALRMELENIALAEEFPSSTFDLAIEALRLSKGDKTFEAQKPGMIRDLKLQKEELSGKYEGKTSDEKKIMLDKLNIRLNDFLRDLEGRQLK